MYLVGGYDYQIGFLSFFYMSSEWNAPSLYSGVLILSIAGLLAYIALKTRSERKAGRKSWIVLAAVFLYLSIDEVFSIHELLGKPTREFFDLSGVFYFSWVLPRVAFAVAVLLASLKLLRRLEPPTRTLMLLAGAIFIAGAVGFEMLGGWRYEAVAGDMNDPVFIILSTCEETLEIAGMSLMLFTLVRYVSGPSRTLTLTVPVRLWRGVAPIRVGLARN
ncbi:MAG: hypothetical protein EXQ94_14685 [Alphaproteobacteria bacterium]|nr:hypothetical protein [Alphaproteobacteria bacterium]